MNDVLSCFEVVDDEQEFRQVVGENRILVTRCPMHLRGIEDRFDNRTLLQ